MSKPIVQVAAFALSALVTAATFLGVNGLAAQQYVKAGAIAMADMDLSGVQKVVVVGKM